MIGFDAVLQFMRNVPGAKFRRPNWHEDRWIEKFEGGEFEMNRRKCWLHSCILLCYANGLRAPWTPTTCDLLEMDWTEYHGTTR